MITPQIETTADGSSTLRHPLTGETYHSMRGAVGESQHVFIGAGLEYAARTKGERPLKVLEIGFGSGLNAWLTARTAEKSGVRVEYHGIERWPVDPGTLDALSYATDPFFGEIHRAAWETPAAITPWFTLMKREADFAVCGFDAIFDVVYFDAFAPDVQPEMWSIERFAALFGTMAPGAVLVTYSAKGSVKRALREAGFEVERLPGALGKRHMIRAIKP